MTSDALTLFSILITAIGSLAALFGIVMVWLQVRASKKIAKGEFLLHLGELLENHQKAYAAAFQPDWIPDQNGVSKRDMDSYLSLFDQIKILIDYGTLDFDVAMRLYSYRLLFLVLNDYIYQESFVKYGFGRPDTIALVKMVANEVRKRQPLTDRSRRFCERADKLTVADS